MRPATPMVALAAMFTAAGGFVHVRDWLEIYRHVPAAAPGSAVVRIGFPINAAASLVLVVALIVVVRRPSRLTQPVIFGALAFQAASLATLIATRVSSVFGWSEPSWTSGAEQTRAVEIAAIIALLALAALSRRDQPVPGLATTDSVDRDRTPTVDPVPLAA